MTTTNDTDDDDLGTTSVGKHAYANHLTTAGDGVVVVDIGDEDRMDAIIRAVDERLNFGSTVFVKEEESNNDAHTQEQHRLPKFLPEGTYGAVSETPNHHTCFGNAFAWCQCIAVYEIAVPESRKLHQMCFRPR
jgi:hypothetical protein